METLACGHVALADTSRMCRHLISFTDNLDYVRLLTGHGLDFDLCCATCDKARPEGAPAALVEVCEGCVAQYADNEYGVLTAWRGEPASRPCRNWPGNSATPSRWP